MCVFCCLLVGRARLWVGECGLYTTAPAGGVPACAFDNALVLSTLRTGAWYIGLPLASDVPGCIGPHPPQLRCLQAAAQEAMRDGSSGALQSWYAQHIKCLPCALPATSAVPDNGAAGATAVAPSNGAVAAAPGGAERERGGAGAHAPQAAGSLAATSNVSAATSTDWAHDSGAGAQVPHTHPARASAPLLECASARGAAVREGATPAPFRVLWQLHGQPGTLPRGSCCAPLHSPSGCTGSGDGAGRSYGAPAHSIAYGRPGVPVVKPLKARPAPAPAPALAGAHACTSLVECARPHPCRAATPRAPSRAPGARLPGARCMQPRLAPAAVRHAPATRKHLSRASVAAATQAHAHIALV